MRGTRTLRPFAHEWLVLALVGLAVLGYTHGWNTQDATRLSLTQAVLEHGEVTIDRYGTPTDRAERDGRLYTDKAPGLSLLAIPPVAAVRAAEQVAGSRAPLLWESAPRLWLVRAAVLGPFLLLLTWLLGRFAEGLVPGSGAATAVAGALGTMLGPLSTILFAHVPAACLAFVAYVLLATGQGRRRLVLAGAAAGTAVLVEYQAGLAVAAVAAYGLWRHGRALLVPFVAGAAPAAVVLAVYDTVAFGAPWRLSYGYVSGAFADQQAGGVFGIGLPRLDSLLSMLVGGRGLLVVSPVLVAAGVGLLLLRRRAPGDAALCAAVVVLYAALTAGYFLPYGGYSPGPRFFAPALPFLLLGLPPALARWPRAVAGLLALSVVLMTLNAMTWPAYAPGVPFEVTLPDTLLWRLGLPREAGLLLGLPALAALGVALLDVLRQRPRAPVHPPAGPGRPGTPLQG